SRLSQRGHNVAAVDVNVDPYDGLAVIRHYENTFLAMQAEFDRLPFAPAQADLVIYNGSFHYSCDYRTSLQEAFRTLKADGQLVIMDTPLYHDRESGETMVRERQTGFAERYGFG